MIRVENKKKKVEEVPVLSNSFLQFSDIFQKENRLSENVKNLLKIPEKKFQSNFTANKYKRNLDAMMILKVNDEILKNKRNSKKSVDYCNFAKNDRIIRKSLNNQRSDIESKLSMRRMKLSQKNSLRDISNIQNFTLDEQSKLLLSLSVKKITNFKKPRKKINSFMFGENIENFGAEKISIAEIPEQI